MLRLTPHGLWEMLIGTIVLLGVGIGLYFLWPPLAILVFPVIVWLFAFFRDPDRVLPGDADVYVSPADGMVSDIIDIPHDELLGEGCVRVGIFLSVFNVHVNRSPCDGRVAKLIYKEGKFLNALKHEACSAQNESNTIVLAEPDGDRPVAVVKQIVGAIARRIVCTPRIGDAVTRGQRIGMIKFGSRTELYIPKRLEPQVMVQVGQKVRGAADVIAKVRIRPALDEMASAASAQRQP
jgi:phosphatidylserine decarboxylase